MIIEMKKTESFDSKVENLKWAAVFSFSFIKKKKQKK